MFIFYMLWRSQSDQHCFASWKSWDVWNGMNFLMEHKGKYHISIFVRFEHAPQEIVADTPSKVRWFLMVSHINIDGGKLQKLFHIVVIYNLQVSHKPLCNPFVAALFSIVFNEMLIYNIKSTIIKFIYFNLAFGLKFGELYN